MTPKSPNPNPHQTILVITVGFLAVYLAGGWKWALYTALAVGVLGLLSGYIARMIESLWMRLAKLLSYIVPNILLSAVFFLVLTPIAWVSRLTGKSDPLFLRKPEGSLFKDRNLRFDPASMEKPW